MKRLTSDQQQQIKTMYADGKTPKEIGEAVGIMNNSVTRFLRNNNIPRTQLIKITPIEEQFIILQYQANWSSTAIGLKLKRDPGNVLKVLKKNNIPIRPATQNKRQYQIQDNYFETIDNQDKAYFLGLLYADGSLNKRSKSIRLTLHEKDKHIVEELSNIIYGFTKVHPDHKIMEDGTIRHYFFVPVYSTKMHQDLCKLGCTPRKTFSIRLPELADDLMRHFVRGFFDGDGCLSVNHSKLGVIDITSNSDFIDDMMIFLKEKLDITSYKGNAKRKSKCLQFSGEEAVKKFLHFIYDDANYFLVRKAALKDEFLDCLENKKNIKRFNAHEKFSKIENYASTYIPSWNGIRMQADSLRLFNIDTKKVIAKSLVVFYRQGGFPFPKLEEKALVAEFQKLQKFDADKVQKPNHKLAMNNYVGSPIFKHFSPHFWEVKSNYDHNPSMVEAFNDDAMLERTILNRLRFNMTINGSMIRQGLRNSRTAFSASNFPAVIAKFIYGKYTQEGSVIYDYSMGFGQRLLAALSLPHKVKYIGTDPNVKSYDANVAIHKFFSDNIDGLNQNVEIHNQGSENYEGDLGSVDLAFSSPPYFDLEVYSEDASQAYASGYEAFIGEWWDKTCSNIHGMLKANGIFAINVKEVLGKRTLSADMLSVAERYGFKLIDTYYLQLSKNLKFNNKLGKPEKLEPIFILQKV